MFRTVGHLLPLILGGLLASSSALAADAKTICVFDPLGTNGTAFKFAQEMRLEAKATSGIDIELKAHVEEKTATADLAAGKCDGAVITGVAARDFGLASATIEALGALPSYNLLKQAIGYMSDPRLAAKMKTGDYETGGIFPAGIVYLFVKNAAWRTSADLAGKSIAVINNDTAATTMAKVVGASASSASTATFGPMFNSGSVDACYAPATAYQPLELYRGVEKGGGVIDYPLSQLTFQLVLRADAWPEDFGQWGRKYAYDAFGKAKTIVSKAEGDLAGKLIAIPEGDKPEYEKKFQQVRVQLRDQGVYNGFVLKLMRGLRCKADAARAECATQVE